VSSTSMGGGGVGQAWARAFDLYALSASDEEIVPAEPHRKRSLKSPLKAILKPFDTSAVEGTSV
jgi:hypothetical protein